VSAIHTGSAITATVRGEAPVSVATSRSRAPRVGRNMESQSSQPGNACGGMNNPPANASGNSRQDLRGGERDRFANGTPIDTSQWSTLSDA